MNRKHILPLLLIFPVLLVLMTAQPIAMVSASSSNIPDTSGQGQIGSQANGGDNDDDNKGFAPGEPDPSGGVDVDVCAEDGDNDDCPSPPTGPGPGPGPPPPIVAQKNRATSEQTGGISAGDIIQRSNSAVTEQYCKTIAGIGDRRCQQEAPEGALQECSAIAGLGRANCVQSENPDGTGTCLSANGKPFICETSTGKSISGSGQAGQ